MRIPFIHTRAAGLQVTDALVVRVAGVRLGPRLRRLASDAEPIDDEAVAPALGRLRMRHTDPFVTTHLDPLHVRHVVLQGPSFDEAASFEAWLQSEAARQLPPKASLADFVLRLQRLEQTDEGTRCLVALAHRDAVARRVALVEEAGFLPLCVGSLDVAVGEALALDPAFLEIQAAVLLLRPHDASLFQYRAGVLQSLAVLPCGPGTADAVSLLHAVARHLVPAPERLFITGTDAQQVVDAAQAAGLLDAVARQASLDFLLGSTSLPPAHLPAAALALQHLYPPPDALNFLDAEMAEARRVEVEKREAVRAILAVGAIVGLLLLLLTLVTVYLAGQHARAGEDLLARADQIARIEQAYEAVAQLERDLAYAEDLVRQRTAVAGLLEGVGRAAPDGLWLDAVRAETLPPETAHVTLTGAAFDKQAVAAYLERLEQAPFGAAVRLRYAETTGATTLYKQDRVQDQALTRFEIHVLLSRLSHNTAAPE